MAPYQLLSAPWYRTVYSVARAPLSLLIPGYIKLHIIGLVKATERAMKNDDALTTLLLLLAVTVCFAIYLYV